MIEAYTLVKQAYTYDMKSLVKQAYTYDRSL